MRQVRWASWMVGLAMALAVCGVRPAAADVRSDRAAAILEWPSVIFAEDSFGESRSRVPPRYDHSTEQHVDRSG